MREKKNQTNQIKVRLVSGWARRAEHNALTVAVLIAQTNSNTQVT